MAAPSTPSVQIIKTVTNLISGTVNDALMCSESIPSSRTLGSQDTWTSTGSAGTGSAGTNNMPPPVMAFINSNFEMLSIKKKMNYTPGDRTSFRRRTKHSILKCNIRGDKQIYRHYSINHVAPFGSVIITDPTHNIDIQNPYIKNPMAFRDSPLSPIMK